MIFIFTVLICTGNALQLSASLSPLNLDKEKMRAAIAFRNTQSTTVAHGNFSHTGNEYIDAYCNSFAYHDPFSEGRNGLKDNCRTSYGGITATLQRCLDFIQLVRRHGMTVQGVFNQFEEEERIAAIVRSTIPAPVVVHAPAPATRAQSEAEKFKIALEMLQKSPELQALAAAMHQARQ